ncbi:MAG: PAS domain S-box protein, partial [Desulfuromonadales bacterium]|nr:PAS domain S-box protein [Desulfuromonadales bacterium]
LENYPEIKQAVTTRKSVVVADVNYDPLLKLVRTQIDSTLFNSIIVLPVLFHSNVIGVMVVRTTRERNQFMDDELKLCELVANASGNALQHAHDLEVAHLETAALKRSQQQLEHELSIKAIYEMMFDGASEGLLAIAQDMTIFFVNRKAMELCGYTCEELRRMNFADLLLEPSRTAFIEAVRPSETSAILTGMRLDATMKCGDGFKRQVSLSIGDRPRATGLQVLSFRDVTARRMMEAELVNTQSALQEANEKLGLFAQARSEFYSTAAHELRTPVSIINGYVELIEQSGKENLSEKQQEYLGLATESCDRLIDLIGDMLDISRFAVNKMELSIQVNDLADMIRDVCREVRGISDRKEVILEARSGPLCPIPCDELMIRRVLINLIANAVKFTPVGGRITITLDDHEEEVTITVADTGPGIALELIPDLFKEFHTVAQPGGPKGTGLGLSISKKIIDAHHGRIWAESQPDNGSRFCFTLPRNAQA